MLQGWYRMKKYSIAGWKHSSGRMVWTIILVIICLSTIVSTPFWIAFSSFALFLSSYFPLTGFVHELVDQDWDDWHLW